MSLPLDLMRAVLSELEPRPAVGRLGGTPAAMDDPFDVSNRFSRRFCDPHLFFSATLRAVTLVSRAWHRAAAPACASLLAVSTTGQLDRAVERFKRRSDAADAVRTLVVSSEMDPGNRDGPVADKISQLIAACVQATQIVVPATAGGARLPSSCRVFCTRFTSAAALQVLLVRAADSLEALYIGSARVLTPADRRAKAPAMKRLHAFESGLGGYWRVIGPVVHNAGSLRSVRVELDSWSIGDIISPFLDLPGGLDTVTSAVVVGIRPPLPHAAVKSMLSWLPSSLVVLGLEWGIAPPSSSTADSDTAAAVQHCADELRKASIVPILRRIHHIPPSATQAAAWPLVQNALADLVAVCADRNITIAEHPSGSLVEL